MKNYFGITGIRLYAAQELDELNAFLAEHDGNIIDIIVTSEDVVIVYKDAEGTAETLSQKVVDRVFEAISEVYDKHVFGGDLEDTEKEVVMNYSNDIYFKLSEIRESYTRTTEEVTEV
jgi:hypothetical protein